MERKRLNPRFLAIFSVLAGASLLSAAGPSVVYAPAQAAAGLVAYNSSCVTCHTDSLIAADGAQYQGQAIPPLAGKPFMARWGTRTTKDLSSRIREAVGGFPPKGADETTYLDLTAYILQVNGVRPGTSELTAATAVVIQSATGAGETTADVP